MALAICIAKIKLHYHFFFHIFLLGERERKKDLKYLNVDWGMEIYRQQ